MFTPSGSTPLHIAWISHPRDRMKGFMWRSKSSIAFTSCEKTKAEVTMNWRAGYFNWCFFGGKRIGYLYSKSGLKSFQIKESESFEKGTSPPSVKNGLQTWILPLRTPSQSFPVFAYEICNGKTAPQVLFSGPTWHTSFACHLRAKSKSIIFKPLGFQFKIWRAILGSVFDHPTFSVLNRLLFGAYNIHGMVDVCILSIKILPNSFPVEGS